MFDGIPLLIDYQDYISVKDLDSYKYAQEKRQVSKSKILKYLTLVGRLKAIQFVLKNFENPIEGQKASLSEYLETHKQQLQTTNETLVSE